MKSQLLAMSFDTAASPWITPRSGDPGNAGPSGWGFAWFPVDDNAAMVIKDPRDSAPDRSVAGLIGDWERFRSTVFLCHIRGAAKRVTQQDTHPFARSYAARSFIFAHGGNLEGDFRAALALGDHPVFEPLGTTDSEHAFCWLMTRLRETGARSLAAAGWPTVLDLLRQVDALGTANILLSDGIDVVAYRDQDGSSGMSWRRFVPPMASRTLGNEFVEVDISDPLDHSRSVIAFSTTPLEGNQWTSFAPGQMAVARRAEMIWDSTAGSAGGQPAGRGSPQQVFFPPPRQIGDAGPLEVAGEAPAGQPPPAIAVRSAGPQPPASVQLAGPSAAREEQEKTLAIVHETVYSYEQPVEYSTHTLRLHPVHDLMQEVLDYELEVAPMGTIRAFDDVFGNHSVELEIKSSYSELRFLSRSLVRVRHPGDLTTAGTKWTIPLVWMPWQRQMMSPYLLPQELPEAQLRELSEYAMSFVERQSYGLVESLLDMNLTIYRDYQYLSGSTTLETTPFEVYVRRRGVCQDFANLFICLARLLGLPARYRVGYIHTGADDDNKIQSEASHAWAEVYLPGIGWRGFDPTNGCLTGVHHARVAVGRNYRDATPTSGTIYRGGQGETLRVEVRVEPA